ncbi:MAG: hypothetical protein N2747_08075 [Chitinophagaceae bacterium]|nr:hypothetical protein [Chitinophagaceae bacterium]
MEKPIKIGLSVLLLLCLADMPYGYYQFVRFISFAGFSALAYLAHEKNNETEMFIYIGLALLFQPFFKVALGRTLWNIVDVVVAAGLLFSIANKPSGKNQA